jgi:hypothetical protein
MDGQTAGPSTSLRYGRDDNSVAEVKYLPLKLLRPFADFALVAVQEGGVLRVDDAQISGQA